MLIKSRFLNVCVLVYIVLSTYNPTLGVKGTFFTADMVADPSSICRWNPDMYGE